MATYENGKRRSHNRQIIAIVVIILIIAVIALAWPKTNIYYLSSAQSFTIPVGSGIYFKLPGASAISTIYLENSSNSSALIYETNLPILSQPIVAFYLSKNQAVNISSNQSNIANINIILISSATNSATIKISPILATLGIAQSKNVVVFPQMEFSVHGESSSNSIIIPTKTNTTTSVTTTSTVTSTFTTAPTTNASAKALAFANSTKLGQLISEYNTLYKNGVNCNATTYNSTFLRVKSTKPTGLYSFQNVSALTPSEITTKVKVLSQYLYDITYSQEAPSSASTGPIAYIEVNTSTSNYTIVSAAFIGEWQGANLTESENAYNFASGLGNACGAQMLQSYTPS